MDLLVMFNGTVVMQSGGASEYYSLALPVLLRCICPPPDLLPLVPSLVLAVLQHLIQVFRGHRSNVIKVQITPAPKVEYKNSLLYAPLVPVLTNSVTDTLG